MQNTSLKKDFGTEKKCRDWSSCPSNRTKGTTEAEYLSGFPIFSIKLVLDRKLYYKGKQHKGWKFTAKYVFLRNLFVKEMKRTLAILNSLTGFQDVFNLGHSMSYTL